MLAGGKGPDPASMSRRGTENLVAVVIGFAKCKKRPWVSLGPFGTKRRRSQAWSDAGARNPGNAGSTPAASLHCKVRSLGCPSSLQVPSSELHPPSQPKTRGRTHAATRSA